MRARLSHRRVIIVGAGQAGLAVAAALISEQVFDPITAYKHDSPGPQAGKGIQLQRTEKKDTGAAPVHVHVLYSWYFVISNLTTRAATAVSFTF